MDMTGSPLAFWGYTSASFAFLLFFAHMALGWKGGLRGSLILAAVGLSGVWAGTTAVYLYWGLPWLFSLSLLFNALRLCAWFAFLLSLLNAHPGEPAGGSWLDLARPRWVAIAIPVTATSYFLLTGLPSLTHAWFGPSSQAPFAPPLALAIIGLVLVEQVVRNTPVAYRWGLKPMALALGSTFCFDIYLFAEAILFKHLEVDVWGMRGLVHMLTIPLLAMATARTKAWNIRMSISRHVVFHTTALLATGLYLLLIATAGYYLRFFGGNWGAALQTVFLFSGLLLLAILLSSGSSRSKLRVFISKHFFSYRYDYRAEWLRFTQSLSAPPSGGGLPESVIHSLANLVESPGGALWLSDKDGSMRQTARLNSPQITETVDTESPMAEFLTRTQWILDLDELRASPEDYGYLQAPDWLENLKDAWLVIPLFFDQKLFGFVILLHSRAKIEVNWEVLDLLKTAGSQAGSYLIHMRAADALLEAKKFDSFNRMSAFVVHDIKNLVAQLSLLLKNAERHMDNPEFRQDMFMTIAHVVDRMKHLLLQLRAGTTPVDQPRPLTLAPVVQKVCKAKAGQSPAIDVTIGQDAEVMGHAERLERVIGHLVQNALDATPPDGRVWITLSQAGRECNIEVGDSGSGMTPEFIRNRLFKPFDSTKNTGMGVGAYESAQYVAELGGRLDVKSEPGHGTVIRIILPLHKRIERPETELA